MRRLFGHRPSPAMLVACIALAIALGGTSYAALNLPANSVGTKQLKNRAVTKKKISKKTIRALRGRRGPQGPPGPSTGAAGGDLTGNYPTPSIAAGAVTGAKVAADTLGGAQIDESSLEFGNVGCKLGFIHSFARIQGQASMPSNFTTDGTYVDTVHNCSGGTTEVRRHAEGDYVIRFNGDTSQLAIAISNFGGSCVTETGFHDSVQVIRILSGPDEGSFEINTIDPDGFNEEACVTVVTF